MVIYQKEICILVKLFIDVSRETKAAHRLMPSIISLSNSELFIPMFKFDSKLCFKFLYLKSSQIYNLNAIIQSHQINIISKEHIFYQ